MMYSSSKKQRPTGFLIRPKGGLLSSPQEKKKKFKKSGFKMDYRKKDYADTAYREAVSKLRILLAESYTPIRRPLRELDISAGEETDNQSLISGVSRLATRPYYHYLTMLPKRQYYPPIRNISSKFENNNSVPPELTSFMEKQEDYIEQLEKESRFCREELSSLLGKVKGVISENENLHEKQKSHLMRSVFHHLETETETETEAPTSPKPLKKSKVTLEGPLIVFESRISELEAQLTQAKIDLKKALDENETYRKKVSDGNLLDGQSYETFRKQIDNLQREKNVLQETVTKLQHALTKIRDKENDTCDKVKRSLDVAEQAQYEKNAAEMEIRRLKDELDRQHMKLRDAIADQGRKIADERGAVERRYTQQIEQLTAELGVQWETTNKHQLELDKQRRENADLRRELTQKQSLLDEVKKDTQNKIMVLQSDIGVNGAEKSALEQQIATLQLASDRNERQAKQEVARLQAEVQSLRQRLDRADADLIHSRRENIRLGEQVASLEKEVKISSAMHEERAKPSSEIMALPPPKERELSSMIHDMESKHAATVADLEGMIHSQNQLMDKLSGECHTLTKKLEDSSARHKEEIRELQSSLDRLSSRFNQSNVTTGIKDEDYHSVGDQTAPQSEKPIKPLSRTNSKASADLSRKNSRDQYQYSQEYDPNMSYYDNQQYQQQYDQNYDPNMFAQDPNQQYEYPEDPNQYYQAPQPDQTYENVPEDASQPVVDAPDPTQPPMQENKT